MLRHTGGNSPWMPWVGQVRQAALDVMPAPGGGKSAGEAWEEVRRALLEGSTQTSEVEKKTSEVESQPLEVCEQKLF